MTTNNTLDCCIGHLARIKHPSSSAKVKLHGMAKPMTVTKKLQDVNVTMEKYVKTPITEASYAACRRPLAFPTQFNRDGMSENLPEGCIAIKPNSQRHEDKRRQR